MPEPRMVARLGRVIYWFFCIIAVLVGAGLVIWLVPVGQANGWGWGNFAGVALTVAIGAAIPWAIGRAFLYVLAGR